MDFSNNLKIFFESGIAKINFSNNYYSKDVLFNVINVYSDNFYFIMDSSKEYISVTIFNRNNYSDSEFKEGVFEFLNYSLGLIVASLKEEDEEGV